MDDGQWWVLRDGVTLGPYDLDELRQYTTRGKLYADDLVSAAGEREWTPAAAASALQDLFPKDGSEDATVALEPALRALSAPPVPPRRSRPSVSPLRATTLPPRPPTPAPAVVAQPSTPRWYVARGARSTGPFALPELRAAIEKGELTLDDQRCLVGAREWSRVGDLAALADVLPPPVVPVASAAAPRPRGGVGMGLVIGLVAAASVLVIERVIDGPRRVPPSGAPTVPVPPPADAGRALPATAPPPTPRGPAAVAVASDDAGLRGGSGGPRVECLGVAARAGVGRTQGMLRALARLMTDAAPPADTFDYAGLATACLTSVARANDRPRAALDGARVAEALRVRRAAEARQETRSQQWLAMAWTWDADWRTRSVNRAASYGCYEGGWTNDPLEVCPGEWRVRTPALAGSVYLLDGQPTEPELNRRVAGAPTVHPEEEQFCRVLDAQLGAQRLTVSCEGDGAPAFELWLPRELASVGGALAGVLVGDVVRIAGHRMVKREPNPDGAPRGAERWIFTEVPSAGVSIADRTRCCALAGRAAP